MIRYYLSYYLKEFKKIFIDIFSGIGIAYTIVEVINYLVPDWNTEVDILFRYSLLVILILSIIKNTPKKEFLYHIKNKDVKIKIVIGNMFKHKGAKVIPTNTTFDTLMEDDFISSNSVQGQFQEMYFKNNLRTFDTLIENELKPLKSYKELSRKNSKNFQYPIGTTIKINTNKSRIYVLAIADVNEVGKPITSYEKLLVSINKFWEFLLEKGHIETIVMPIIGTGKTGVAISRQKMIMQIIFSFIASTNEKKIVDELAICISPKDYKHIDLVELKEYLDYCCKYYYENDNNTFYGNPVEE